MYAHTYIHNIHTYVQLDTGITCNVMTLDELCNIKQHGDPQMDSSTAKLKLYNITMIPVLGEANLQ